MKGLASRGLSLADVRSCFPGTHDKVFLDAACVSLLPRQAEEALARLTDEYLSCPARDASAHHIALDGTAETPLREAARLIGARVEDIALIESTTHGLQIIAAAVPPARGDNILVGDIEFLGVAVPWIPRAERAGFEIRVVANRHGRLCVDDFAAALDARTRLILLSSVQWNNGYRADLAGFIDLARRHDALLVVDAIQQLGAIALDVGTLPVDVLVTGGHKWLNAPAGRGFMYLHPRVQERLLAPAWGYLNIRAPAQGWTRYFGDPAIPAVRPYEFTPTARRFEIGGTTNYPGNVVLGASLSLINALGIDAIERRIVELSDVLIESLHAAGATVVSPRQAAERSSITTFTLGDGAARDTALLDFLLDRRILISQRYTANVGGLRVSVHFFNNEDDVRQLGNAVREFAG